MNETSSSKIAIIGGGFTGLTAAYELAKKGINVTLIEKEPKVGGLAAAFDMSGFKLDQFYHHWFTNDSDVMALIQELDLINNVKIHPTNTSLFFDNKFFKLSSPIDVMKFSPLSIANRIRLGLLALRARRVKDWMSLENMTAHEWLCNLGGEEVYSIIWEPLLKGKFGIYADHVSAVWFWNKLKLRGGSRGYRGEERLAYLKGGFFILAETLAKRILDLGGEIETKLHVTDLSPFDGKWMISTSNKRIIADRVIVTTALPIFADIIQSWANEDYIKKIRRVKYIGNICLVLELDRPLSNIYWLNVNEPNFPFIGVIEHTNFIGPENYGGKHIVYLSKYLQHTDSMYSMNANEFLEYSLPYLKRIFPNLNRNWIKNHTLWKARWSQPIVEKHYSQIIPQKSGPIQGLFISSMAQIYPEDRGTNYAIREGKKIAAEVLNLR